jgi:hypothetical protein
MPPIEQSLRGSLLTGASALALSFPAAGAHAQTAHHHRTQTTHQDAVRETAQDPPAPTWTLWAEGALSWTGGGSFNVPSLPGLGAPYTAFKPKSGLEGAVGFDYRWPGQPWHFVFDIRYGKSRTATANSSFSTSAFPIFSSASTTHATEHESHLVTDFMVGRDFGLGVGTSEVQFGIRIADLAASAQEQEADSGFILFSPFSTTAGGTWRSRFVGAGPRLAITGSVPITGLWSFDYGAGIAELFGRRSFNANASSAGFSLLGPFATSFVASNSSTVGVFNADGSAALSYSFTPTLKVSGGIRGDYYSSALTTYNVSTGAYKNIDRLYWGPFARLTSAF